jgi:LEA14-like dessication related protein
MSRRRIASVARIALSRAAIAGALVLAACGASQQPQLKVLSVENSAITHAGQAADRVLFVEVVNPAARPLELHRLQYRFEPSVYVAGVEAVHGEVLLSRIVDPGAAVVVEVPLPHDDSLPLDEELMLSGRLYATQDQLQRSFDVRARVAAVR